MKDERENFSEAQDEIQAEAQEAAQDEAQTEAEIDARELTREILPLLKEHFVAVCRLFEDGISMRFPNGQTATVAVWFCKK